MKPIIFLSVWLCAEVGALGATSPAAQNWPQWRGPAQDGVAPNANPPTTWSETQNVKWKVEVPGEGHATPIIWGDKIFIQTAIATGKKVEAAPAAETAPGPGPGGRRGFGGAKPTEAFQFTLICIDRTTGKTLWQQVAKEVLPHEGHHPTSTFASCSPVTDGEHIYAYFGSQGIYCYDLQGKLVWTQDLGRLQIQNQFGEGTSPAIFGDSIVVKCDHEGEDYIVALDKRDGKTLWKTPREEKTSWSTPLVVDYNGKPQVVTTATGKIRSYDLTDGKMIWEHAGLTRNTIPSPVAANGVVYAMSGFMGNALYAIRLGKNGDLTDSDSVLWKYNKSTPYVPSPLLVDDKLYFFAGNNEILSCFDVKSGKPLIDAERVPGLKGIYASPIAAGGHVYLASQNGATVVLKISDKLDVVATNSLDESFDASPVAVGNELFLRGHRHLYCIAEK